MDDTRDPRDPGPADVTGPATDGPTPDDAATEAAVARVRAADPAAGSVPDTAVLHARLTEATGVPLAVTDELAAARARRRGPARWLQVAAVAAGVALVGGGGYAVGASGGSEPAAPPIALQGGGAGGAAPAATRELAAADAKMVAPGWFGGRTVFRGSGLEGAAGSARAWTYDATEVATAETARLVAGRLGVPGEPRQEWGQWVVGENDGVSPVVQVGIDGLANVWFYDRAWDPSVCGAGDGASSDAAGPALPEQADPAAGAVETLPAPDVPAEPAPADPSVCDPASTPRGDAAVGKARDVLGEWGVDLTGYEFTVTDETGVPGLVSVTGAQVVDGTQTGLGWSVQLAGTGVQSVSGPLATLVELGTYDYVSADEAVQRLNDPRFGASNGGVVPLAARAEPFVAEDTVGTLEVPATDEATVPPVPARGDRVPWPVQEVTITSARLGVTLLTAPTGATLLVPAWELSDADGGTWSVVAVVEDQLDLSAA